MRRALKEITLALHEQGFERTPEQVRVLLREWPEVQGLVLAEKIRMLHSQKWKLARFIDFVRDRPVQYSQTDEGDW